MTLLDREVIAPSISTRGIIYSAFLLLLVVALFFIPEIVHFQESVTKSDSKSNSVAPSSSVNIDELIAPPATSTGPLDKVLSLLSGGGSRSPEGRSKEGLIIPAPEVAGPNQIAETGTQGSLKDIQDKVMLEKTFSSTPQVTWEQLNSAPVKKAFSNAENNAGTILRGLNGRQSAVRFALINYINGLAWISRGDRKIMSADEAMAYIEQLDINVTQAMLNSGVDAVDFEAWKRISFGPLSLNSRAAALKLGNTIAFNPRLTLASVDIQRKPDYIQHGNGEWVRNPNLTSSLKLSGFVLGKDVRKIVVFHDGRRVADLHVSARDSEDGLRVFNWRYRTAEGLFTLRAYSKYGDESEKYYVFLPKVYKRFPQDAQGYYHLPFGSEDSDLISLRNLDSRLDRYFRIVPRGSEEGSGASGFDTF